MIAARNQTSVADKIAASERTIAEWTAERGLSIQEAERIRSALHDPAIDDVDAAMMEELEGVLAARRIAKMNLPTAETMRKIRAAFDEGRLPVTSLPVD